RKRLASLALIITPGAAAPVESLRLNSVCRRERLSAYCRSRTLVLRLRSVLVDGGNFCRNDLNFAFEIGAIFNDDAGGSKVAHQAAALANCNLPACFDIAVDTAEHFDFPRPCAGAYFAARSNGQAAIRHVKRTVDLAIDMHILFAGDLSPDHHCLTDDG